MTDTTIQPALTAEEWRRAEDAMTRESMLSEAADCVLNGYDDAREERYEPECWHAAAALALHGQPFGFTREDVRRLREIFVEHASDCRHRSYVEKACDCEAGKDESLLQDLADRIEALLPPE